MERTKAELQVALCEAKKEIEKLASQVYQARKARRAVQTKVKNLRWEEAQAKAKGDAYNDTATRFEAVLDDWPKE